MFAFQNVTVSPEDLQILADTYISEFRQKDLEAGNIRLKTTSASRKAEIKFREDVGRRIIDAEYHGQPFLDPDEIRLLATKLGIALASNSDAHAAQAHLARRLAAYQFDRADMLRSDQQLERPGVFQSLLQTLGLQPERVRTVRVDEQDLHFQPRADVVRSATTSPLSRFDGVEGQHSNRHDRSDSADPSPRATENPLVPISREPLVSTVAEPSVTQMSQPSVPSSSAETIGDLWDEFVTTKIDLQKVWKKSRRPELAGTISMVKWLGFDLNVLSFDVRIISQLSSAYLSLPESYPHIRQKLATKRRCELRDVAVADVKAAAIRLAGGGTVSTVAPKTWNKHSSNLTGFFDWLIKRGVVSDSHSNPMRHGHISIKKKGRFGRDERDAYSLEDVEKIFSTPIWQGRKSIHYKTLPGSVIVRDSSYWVPLICAYHGLRREEASQLKVRHVCKVFDIWVFDLFAPDLTLKGDDTGGSPRKIPLHRDFLCLGFLEDKVIGRDPDKLLFEELNDDNAHGMFGSNFGKSFGYYLNKIGIFEPGTEVGVHRFRHTFSTQLENTTAKESFISELTGHIDEKRSSERNRYTKMIFVQNLKDTIDLLVLPIHIPIPGTPGLKFIEPQPKAPKLKTSRLVTPRPKKRRLVPRQKGTP